MSLPDNYTLALRRLARGQTATKKNLARFYEEARMFGHVDETNALTVEGYAVMLSGSLRDKLAAGSTREAFGAAYGVGRELVRTEVIMLAETGLLVRGQRGDHRLTELGERLVAFLRAEAAAVADAARVHAEATRTAP